MSEMTETSETSEKQIVEIMKLPERAIRYILTCLPNLWPISQTCKYLYELVCERERFKYVIRIDGILHTNTTILLSIDDNAYFNSIMNTRRLFKAIHIRLEPKDFLFSEPNLQHHQFIRILAIHRRFASNVTSIYWTSLELKLSEYAHLMRALPKLESISMQVGRIREDSVREPIVLPNLTTVECVMVHGFYNFLNLLSEVSIVRSDICSADEHRDTIKVYFNKQRHIRYLNTWHTVDRTLIGHLTLEQLGLHKVRYKCNRISQVLRNMPNLRVLAFQRPISGNSFNWICDNMRNLEKFRVQVDKPEVGDLVNVNKLLSLKSFETRIYEISDIYPVKSDTITLLTIDEPKNLCLTSNMSKSQCGLIASNFPNVQLLYLQVDSVRRLFTMLNCFRNLTKYVGWVENPNPRCVINRTFPNMKHIAIISEMKNCDATAVISIINAMPNLEFLSINVHSIFNPDLILEMLNGRTNLMYFEMLHIVIEKTYRLDSRFVTFLKTLEENLRAFHLLFRVDRDQNGIAVLLKLLSKEFKVKVMRHMGPNVIAVFKGGLRSY